MQQTASVTCTRNESVPEAVALVKTYALQYCLEVFTSWLSYAAFMSQSGYYNYHLLTCKYDSGQNPAGNRNQVFGYLLEFTQHETEAALKSR